MVSIINYEGLFKRTHLEQNATERPDISRETIFFLSLDHFRRHVERCSCTRFGTSICMFDDRWHTEISQFNVSLLCKEYVVRLEISVDTVSCMNVSKSEAHLNEHVDDFIFFEVIFRSNLCLFCNLLTKVATICVFHYDAQFALFGSVDLIIFNNMRMFEEREKFSLFDCILLSLLANRVDIHLLNDVLLLCILLKDKICFTLSSGFKTLDLLVSLCSFSFHYIFLKRELF